MEAALLLLPKIQGEVQGWMGASDECIVCLGGRDAHGFWSSGEQNNQSRTSDQDGDIGKHALPLHTTTAKK